MAFLGGPLHFLSSLRDRFVDTLNLEEGEAIYPENAQLYVAIGAAISSASEKPISYERVKDRLENTNEDQEKEIKNIEPLFKEREDYEKFKERHNRYNIKQIDPKEYKGRAYLGIDAGSTTTKAVIISEDDEVLYSYYGSNKGKPIDQSIFILN